MACWQARPSHSHSHSHSQLHVFRLIIPQSRPECVIVGFSLRCWPLLSCALVFFPPSVGLDELYPISSTWTRYYLEAPTLHNGGFRACAREPPSIRQGWDEVEAPALRGRSRSPNVRGSACRDARSLLSGQLGVGGGGAFQVFATSANGNENGDEKRKWRLSELAVRSERLRSSSQAWRLVNAHGPFGSAF